MDLKEFASLIVGSANEAKNHVSFLIGNLGSREEAGKAILGLYESFPENYKDKDLFTPVMLKFFNTYDVSKENISYYNEFSPGWTSSNIENVKKINPHWEWTKTEYKNSLEFSKAVYNSRDYEDSDKIFEFLDNNSETLKKLIKKDKSKIITNFSKQNCWRELASHNYDKFSNFCEKYDFDKIDILKTEFIESYYGIERLLFQYKPHELVSLFKDLEKNDFYKIFEKSHFLANRAHHNPNIANRSGYTVLDTVLRFIAEDKFIEADFFMQKFPEFIQQNFTHYCYREKPNNDLLGGLQQCVDSIVKTSKERHHNYNIEPRELGHYSNVFEDKFKTFKEYIEVVKFKESLEDGIGEKSKKSIQRKI